MNAIKPNPLLCDPETGLCEIPAVDAGKPQRLEANSGVKQISVLYYTDPICSSCWGIEPQLRKLKLEYGHVLNFEYKMGGLLPDWSYNSGGISQPLDVASHWDEVSRLYQMPIDGDVWLEDPLHSSYPPSIAFKAAQIQDSQKAVEFLRRLREMLFLQKRNITKWKPMAEAAAMAGLDVDRLKQDYEGGAAEKLFKQDLADARQMGVRGFPSVFLTNETGNVEFVYGSKPYSVYESAIRRLFPGVERRFFDNKAERLLEVFGTLTPKEFAALSNISLERASAELEGLAAESLMKVIRTRNGNLYSAIH